MAYTFEKLDGCHFFGIWPEQIEDACTTCEDVLERYGLGSEIDDVYEFAEEHLHELLIGDQTHLSNQICDALFYELKVVLNRNFPDLNVDYYVNGSLDTNFYIEGEPV